LANSIAFDVREAGRILRDGDPVTGKIVKDESGEPVRIPGTLKKVRAIGWFIQEYGIAQISMNLTDIETTPIHKAFDEVCERARDRGVRVTGSELIGMIPLQTILDAGKYFLQKQHRSLGLPDHEIIKIAIKSMGLDELAPFDPNKRIIEYLMMGNGNKLVNCSIVDFARETASDSPAPGGGSVAAIVGALGAALGTMVANLTAHKRGYDARWEEYSDWAEKGKSYYEELLKLVDQDTEAFNQIMEAFKLPKATKEEVTVRKNAVQSATQNAIEIPFKVMKTAYQSLEVIESMANIGNPNSVTDAGVGALCATAAVSGAYLNVLVNASGYNDKSAIAELLSEAESIERLEKEWCEKIQTIVRVKIDQIK
jgi:glutamate formiminotransferase/formiminotetrahydrofolate cyclodeaminase